jgi:hypothetical protein
MVRRWSGVSPPLQRPTAASPGRMRARAVPQRVQWHCASRHDDGSRPHRITEGAATAVGSPTRSRADTPLRLMAMTACSSPHDWPRRAPSTGQRQPDQWADGPSSLPTDAPGLCPPRAAQAAGPPGPAPLSRKPLASCSRLPCHTSSPGAVAPPGRAKPPPGTDARPQAARPAPWAPRTCPERCPLRRVPPPGHPAPGEPSSDRATGVIWRPDADELTRVHHLLGRGRGRTAAQAPRQLVSGHPGPAGDGHDPRAGLHQGHREDAADRPRPHAPEGTLLTAEGHLLASRGLRPPWLG